MMDDIVVVTAKFENKVIELRHLLAEARNDLEYVVETYLDLKAGDRSGIQRLIKRIDKALDLS